ncbi:MAG: response regulator [Leptospira sp.]|nr:response regulator [Leptospira sp.]
MGKINILVVEDEPYIGLSIRKRLEKLGYHVIMVVASGDEAYQVSAERVPDLILMDIHLEGTLDGIETARTLWNNFSVPIVFVTGNVDPTIQKQVLDSWCYGFVAKPFQGMELETSVATAINRIFVEKYENQGELNALEYSYHPVIEWVQQYPDQIGALMDEKSIIQEKDRFSALQIFQLLTMSQATDDDLSIDMKEFLSQVSFLIWNQRVKSNTLNWELLIDSDSIVLTEKVALPVAIILSEALTNSLQYAFTTDLDKGIVSIKFQKNKTGDKMILKIKDNGKGFQESAYYPDTSKQLATKKGLGLKIIEGMATLLGGEYFLNGEQGTTLEVIFPCSFSEIKN